MLNHRMQMLSVIRGESVPVLPWAPRLDLWYRANRTTGTLPLEYEGWELLEIVKDLGCGFHAVVPDFQNHKTPMDDIDRALGIYNLPCMSCHTILEKIERKIEQRGDETHVQYITPVGSIKTTVVYNEQMKNSGITIKHIKHHAFQQKTDYAPLNWIFQNAQVVPNFAGYKEYASQIGDRGITVDFVVSSGSGMHWILHQLMRLDTFYYEMNDHLNQIEELAESIQYYIDNMVKMASKSNAEVYFVGGNYDSGLTYPPFFKKYILPSLKKSSALLHAQGKYLLTHTDGENMGLLDHYLESQIDIADSICPSPMTRLTYGEVRSVFEDKITIMGGIPSVSLLKSSMPDHDFQLYMDNFFKEIGDGKKLILGISDTTPPAADINRIRYIGEKAAKFQMKY